MSIEDQHGLFSEKDIPLPEVLTQEEMVITPEELTQKRRSHVLQNDVHFRLGDDGLYVKHKADSFPRRLSSKDIEYAKQVLNGHIIDKRNPEEYLRSMIFCIASQFTRYERAGDVTGGIMDLTYEEMLEPEGMWSTLGGIEGEENRFEPFIEYIEKYSGGIGQLVEDYLANPFALREDITKSVRWVAHKTASFWYLSLGGEEELMTLDVHVRKQLYGLGVEMRDGAWIGSYRTKKKKWISSDPQPNRYIDMEDQAIRIGEQLLDFHPEFATTGGYLNTSLFTALFWETSANNRRDRSTPQMDFVGGVESQREKMLKSLPYTNK